MPEGDTIYRAALTLDRALGGRTVARFVTGYAQLARVDHDTPLAGRKVERVRSHGKHLLMHFSGGLVLRTHMRMSGSWHIYRRGEPWQRPEREMRIVIETADEPALGPAFVAVAFLVPVAEFLDDRAAAVPDEPADHVTRGPHASDLHRAPALGRLGPDLLADDFDPAVARARLRARPDLPMSEVLLDQSIAAGAGNVFRSETLFLAGIDPARPAGALSDAQIEQLFALARKLLKANVGPAATGGIVTYRGRRGRGNPDDSLWVYGRGAAPCRRCGTPIAYRKTGPDARGLYYCPVCQK